MYKRQAYGISDGDGNGGSNGRKNIHGIAGAYASKVYVLKEDAVYLYDWLNHSLILHKEGDYRDVGMYDDAFIKIGIVWDSHTCSNEMIACAEIGEIGQNVYFVANALDLGTVTTAGFLLSRIGFPPAEEPKIVMPIGHPKCSYNFTYKPLFLSNLPAIKNSSMGLSDAICNRNEGCEWKGELTEQEISQILWTSYGFSYYVDNCLSEKNKIVRHRTVPSAHAYYPLKIYVVTQDGVYRYIAGLYRYYMWNLPVLHSLIKIQKGDYRQEIADASSMPSIASAPCIIISVLEKMAPKKWMWMWYYEAGASAYNVLLEATAWNLSANIVLPTDSNTIRSVLRLNQNFLPLFIVPVGKY